MAYRERPRGVVAGPGLLVRYQARLQLTNAEIMSLLHVLRHGCDASHWPWWRWVAAFPPSWELSGAQIARIS
jgi:hypothetical protein